MRLSFEAFKQKLAETKAKIAEAFSLSTLPRTKGGKLSETQKKRWARARRVAPRAACDSFRYKHKHQHETPTARRRLRRWLSDRRAKNQALKEYNSSLRKSA